MIDNASCHCGAVSESPYHYFFECPDYNELRAILVQTIERYTECTLNTVLCGVKDLNVGENRAIFDAVHTFITESRRFN